MRNNYFLTGNGAELVFPHYINKQSDNVIYNNIIGVEGYVSVSGELWSG